MDRTTRWGQSRKVISSRPGQKQSWKIAKNVCMEIMWIKKEKKVIHLTSTLEWQLIEKGPPYHARGADWGGGGGGGVGGIHRAHEKWMLPSINVLLWWCSRWEGIERIRVLWVVQQNIKIPFDITMQNYHLRNKYYQQGKIVVFWLHATNMNPFGFSSEKGGGWWGV